MGRGSALWMSCPPPGSTSLGLRQRWSTAGEPNTTLHTHHTTPECHKAIGICPPHGSMSQCEAEMEQVSLTLLSNPTIPHPSTPGYCNPIGFCPPHGSISRGLRQRWSTAGEPDTALYPPLHLTPPQSGAATPSNPSLILKACLGIWAEMEHRR